ncbi:hypothetical protein CPB85DRAFT_1438677 [Mucidula mucida]|nr:hypothetical protein CPB85DRAFT_1438677 [Mucidula mucida]
MPLHLIGYPANSPAYTGNLSFDARVRAHFDVHKGCPGCYQPTVAFSEYTNLISQPGTTEGAKRPRMAVQTFYFVCIPHWHSHNNDCISHYMYMSYIRTDFCMTLSITKRGRRIWVRDFLLTWTEILAYLLCPTQEYIPSRYADSTNHFPYDAPYFLACCRP